MENPTTSPAPSSSSSTVPRSSPAVAGHSATWPLLPEPLSPAPTPMPNWNNIPPTPKPVSNLLAAFQATLSGHLAGRSLLDPEVQAATTTYNTLFYLSTMERAAEACDNVGQNAFKLTPLLRELNKAQSLNDRATSRASREQRDKEKEANRIEREKLSKETEAIRLERDKERTHRRLIEMEHKERSDATKLRIEECKLQRVLSRPARKQLAADNRELAKPKSTRGKRKHEANPALDPSVKTTDIDLDLETCETPEAPEPQTSSPDSIDTSVPALVPPEPSGGKDAHPEQTAQSTPASASEISNLKSAIPPSPPQALEPQTSSPDSIDTPTPAPVPPESSGGEDAHPEQAAGSTPDSPPPSSTLPPCHSATVPLSPDPTLCPSTPSLLDPSLSTPENPTTESVRCARENTYENEKNESKPQDPPPEELDPNRPTRRRISPEQAAAERDEIRSRLKPHLRSQFAWLDEFEEEDAKYRIRRQPIIRENVRQSSYLR